jgi:ABC-2 type transport system ATP-binding protein
MGQRLGIATALLADPEVVMLDEPANGLDPDGILWIRELLKGLADEGRTVFLSSHLMSEMEVTADHLIVVGHGRVIADQSIADFIAQASGMTVHVTSPDAERLARLLAGPGITVTSTDAESLDVVGLAAAAIGDAAATAGIRLHQLVTHQASLEEAFMELTKEAVDFHGGTDGGTHGGTHGRTDGREA